MRSAVVFPHPDGPTRIMNSPSGTSRLMSSTATVPSGKLLRDAFELDPAIAQSIRSRSTRSSSSSIPRPGPVRHGERPVLEERRAGRGGRRRAASPRPRTPSRVGRSSEAAKWSDAATRTPVEKQWGTTSTRALPGELRDLPRDGEAPAAGEVRLEDVDVARARRGGGTGRSSSPPRRPRCGWRPRLRAAGSRRSRPARAAPRTSRGRRPRRAEAAPPRASRCTPGPRRSSACRSGPSASRAARMSSASCPEVLRQRPPAELERARSRRRPHARRSPETSSGVAGITSLA